MQILLVEDDKNLGQGIKTLLEIDGYQVTLAENGAEAIDEFKFGTAQYDVVLLDWMLPEFSGIEVCKWLRDIKKGHYTGGIVFLTAKSELDDCVQALEVGADDYITKPFEIRELKARIRAVLRRKNKPYVDNVYEAKGYVLDCTQNTLSNGAETLNFSKTEFKILQIFFINNGKTILRETLFEKVWGDNLEISGANLDSYIYNLRKKLKIWQDKMQITLLKNIGYTLEFK